MIEADGSGLQRYGFLHDVQGRMRRGRRIIAALEQLGGVNVARSRILDIGCSAGVITRTIASCAAFTVGADIDVPALFYANTHPLADERVAFCAASGERLPFPDAIFDVVICNHVYEHARDAERLMTEVARVLRLSGKCYFSGGHTLQVVEPHYRLPLLSWLPRKIAHRYLRASGQGDHYDEQFVLPWRMRRLFSGFSRSRFISPDMLQAWRQYDLVPAWWPNRASASLPRPIAFLSACLAPTYIWLLEK